MINLEKQISLVFEAKGLDATATHVGNLARNLKNLVIPAAFTRGLQQLIRYNKDILQAANLARSYGVSLGQLEKNLEQVRKETNLTRRESLDLFKTYQRGMFYANNFAGTMRNLEQVFGANTEAMREMMGVLISLSSIAPQLAAELGDLGRGQDIEGLRSRIELLRITGDISLEQYRNLEGYIQDVTSGERDRNKANIESMQQFHRALEDIGLALGQTITPLLQGIASILKTINNLGGGLAGTVTAAIAPIFLLFRATRVGGGLLGALGNIGGGAAGMGGMGGIKGMLGTLKGGGGMGGMMPRGLAAAGISMVGNLIGGAIQEKGREQKSTGMTALGGTISGAATGASIGMMFGPWGAAIGGAVGGVVGLVSSLNDAKKAADGVGDGMGEAGKEGKNAADEAMRLKLQTELTNNLLGQQQALMNTLVQRHTVIGDISRREILAAQARVRQTIDDQIALTKDFIVELEKRAALAEKEGQDVETRLKTMTLISDQQSKLNDLEMARTRTATAVADALEGHVNLAQTQAAQMENLVTLSESYALGVGASAEMRMQAVDAEREIQRILEMQVASLRSSDEFKRRDLAVVTAVMEKENAILQSQQRQAQQLRSLRDGWISAIGAMNTGAGRFAKITFDQVERTGAALRQFGAAQTYTTGGLGAGFTESERISAMGDITTASGERHIGPRTPMYGTVSHPAGPEGVALGREEQLRQAQRFLGEATQGRGGLALGGGGHPSGLAAFFTDDQMSDFANRVATAIQNAGEQATPPQGNRVR